MQDQMCWKLYFCVEERHWYFTIVNISTVVGALLYSCLFCRKMDVRTN